MNYTKGERYVGSGEEYWYVASKTDDRIIARFRNKDDAALDAAAPTMYEALKLVTTGSDIRDGEVGLLHCPSREAVLKAFQALALAEGK